jgi:hypothetical protein
MLIPISTEDAARTQTGILLLEVWDKAAPSEDYLLGVVKLSLAALAPALQNPSEESVYPMVAYDEYQPVNDVRSGKDTGYLKVCLALGTSAQIHRLSASHKEFSEIPPVTNKPAPVKVVEPEKEVKKVKPEPFVAVEPEKPKPDPSPAAEIDLQASTESLGEIADIASLIN